MPIKTQVYLKFENDEKLNAFLKLLIPMRNNIQTLDSSVGSNFNEKEIRIAVERFGAKVIASPE